MSNGHTSKQTTGKRWWASSIVLLLTAFYYLTPWDQIPRVSEVLGIPFVFIYTVLLPGVILQERLAPRRTGILEKLAAASLFGLSLFMVIVFVWTLTGTPLSVFERFLPAVIVLLAVLHVILRREREPLVDLRSTRADRVASVAFAAVLVWLFVQVFRAGVPIDFTKDTLDHVGYVAEIVETQSAFPTTAFYIDPGPNGEDIRKGLLHVFYGYCSGYLHLDPLKLLTAINAMFAVLLLLAVYSTGLLLFENRKIAILSAIFFLIALDGGLRSTMIRQSFYPHRFGIVFFFYVLVHGLRFMKTADRRELLPGALFAFAACATHVFFALLVGFAGLAIAVWKFLFPQHNGRVHVRRVMVLGASVVLGMLPFCLYRYLTAFPEANELHGEIQGVVFVTKSLYIMDPLRVYRWFGPIGVLSLLTIIPLWRHRERYPLLGYVFASSLTILVVLFNPVLLPPLRDAITYLIARLNTLCLFYFAAAYFVVTFFSSKRPGDRSGVFRKILIAALSLAVLHGVRPVLGENTFSPERLKTERLKSYLRWADELRMMENDLPPHSVIASDPLTSYSITAFTPHYVVCTFDQHAPPNDLLLEERVRAARDILSPYVPMSRTVELLSKNRATHVVLNDRFPRDLTLEYWLMNHEIFPVVRQKFAAHPELFEMVYGRDDFVVFEWNGDRADADTSFAMPFVLSTLPENFVKVGKEAGEAVLEGIALTTDAASRGGVVDLALVWSGDRSYPLGNYVVTVRFDHSNPGLPFGGKPFPKVARKLTETLVGKRYRFREQHKIRSGFLSPDTWRPGDLVLDETRVSVPLDLAPGEYTVSVKLLKATHQPTYRLSDFLYDEDVYQGIPVGRIVIE